MRSATTLLTAENRVNRAKLRLNELSGGSAEKLAWLRDNEKNTDIELRKEVAYLVQLVNWQGRRPVEVCVAGHPDDGARRRVFAKVTHTQDDDGSVVDVYTRVRTPAPWAVPFVVENKPPARVRVKKETGHVQA